MRVMFLPAVFAMAVVLCGCGTAAGPDDLMNTDAADSFDAASDVVDDLRADIPSDIVECGNPDAMVTLSGQVVQAIHGEWHDMDGGVVSIVGRDDIRLEMSGRDFGYELQVPSCTEVVVRLEHPVLHTVHSGIVYTGDHGIDGVTLQTPDLDTFNLLMFLSGVEMDPEKCQMATTVTDVEHLTDIPCDYCGEPHVKVALDPSVEKAHGPIYFEIGGVAIIYPQPELTETTEDGGVLFVNLEAGDYEVYGWRDGLVMTSARFHCEPGWFVNPAPPRGIQVQP